MRPDLALQAIIEENYFSGGSKDQVMLFSSPPPSPSSLPKHLISLIDTLKILLEPLLPPATFGLIFNQDLARQAILNLYPPGSGITPHIDLPNRYADGILGVSLIGGTVMVFTKPGTDKSYSVYLPARSVYIMTSEARWEWEHGIPERFEDVVAMSGKNRTHQSEHLKENSPELSITMLRETRLSVSFRWMKHGADVLG